MKQRRLDEIHAYPLPVKVYPVTAIVPHNPLSVVWYVWSWIKRYYCNEDRQSRVTVYANIQEDGKLESCFVFDPSDMRVLWDSGFFGKGTLSRSEPTWFKRTNDKLAFDSNGHAEDLTRKRRTERARFKRVRGIIEEKKTNHRRQFLDDCTQEDLDRFEQEAEQIVISMEQQDRDDFRDTILNQGLWNEQENCLDQVEKLQLSRAETLFLLFGLDVICVMYKNEELSVDQVFNYMVNPLTPDNPVLIEYIVYHHYRSLGWCVRNGVKFATDYLLYRRGPPFQHAEYGIVICTGEEEKEWWWGSAIARVVGGVKKTLVFCHVTIPSSEEFTLAKEKGGIESLVKLYEIREVTLRRWVPNRQRD